MGTVILIGTTAIVVAIVGCFVIWRLDAARAEEVEHVTPVVQPGHRPRLQAHPVAGALPGTDSTSAPAPDPEPAPPRTLDP